MKNQFLFLAAVALLFPRMGLAGNGAGQRASAYQLTANININDLTRAHYLSHTAKEWHFIIIDDDTGKEIYSSSVSTPKEVHETPVYNWGVEVQEPLAVFQINRVLELPQKDFVNLRLVVAADSGLFFLPDTKRTMAIVSVTRRKPQMTFEMYNNHSSFFTRVVYYSPVTTSYQIQYEAGGSTWVQTTRSTQEVQDVYYEWQTKPVHIQIETL